jgi:hypothetical protein
MKAGHNQHFFCWVSVFHRKKVVFFFFSPSMQQLEGQQIGLLFFITEKKAKERKDGLLRPHFEKRAVAVKKATFLLPHFCFCFV